MPRGKKLEIVNVNPAENAEKPRKKMGRPRKVITDAPVAATEDKPRKKMGRPSNADKAAAEAAKKAASDAATETASAAAAPKSEFAAPHFKRLSAPPAPPSFNIFDEEDIDFDELDGLLTGSTTYTVRVLLKLISELSRRCGSIAEFAEIIDECVSYDDYC